MQVSQFRIFAIGVAAEHKPLKSKQLKVTPTEMLPMISGELAENPTPTEFKGVDANGTPYQGKVFTDNVIEATWLPEGSNRITPPDVRRGETVAIYRFSDGSKYYWRTLGLNDNLRALETVIFAISADPNGSGKDLDTENSYFIEVSSHTKSITVHTSTKNGEPYGYDIQLNAGQGKFIITDTSDNAIGINSEVSEVYLHTVGGHLTVKEGALKYAGKTTEFKLDRLSITCSDKARIDAGGSFIEVDSSGIKLNNTFIPR